jgi:hypothetical protein
MAKYYTQLAVSNISLMMEAASTSATSVHFYQTARRNKPEDSNLHIRRRKNLKYHSAKTKQARSTKFVFPFHDITQYFIPAAPLVRILKENRPFVQQ